MNVKVTYLYDLVEVRMHLTGVLRPKQRQKEVLALGGPVLLHGRRRWLSGRFSPWTFSSRHFNTR